MRSRGRIGGPKDPIRLALQLHLSPPGNPFDPTVCHRTGTSYLDHYAPDFPVHPIADTVDRQVSRRQLYSGSFRPAAFDGLLDGLPYLADDLGYDIVARTETV